MIESDFALGIKQGRAVEHSVMLERIEDIKAEMSKVTDDDLKDYWHKCDKFLEIIDKHIRGKADE